MSIVKKTIRRIAGMSNDYYEKGELPKDISELSEGDQYDCPNCDNTMMWLNIGLMPLWSCECGEMVVFIVDEGWTARLSSVDVLENEGGV